MTKPKNPKQTMRQLRGEIERLKREVIEHREDANIARSSRDAYAKGLARSTAREWTDPAPSADDYARGWDEAKMDGLATVLENPAESVNIHRNVAPVAAKILRDWLRRRKREAQRGDTHAAQPAPETLSGGSAMSFTVEYPKP